MLALTLLAGCVGDVKSSSQKGIALMAYNVLYNSTETEKSLELIKAYDPDVLCLREMTPKFAKAFVTKLGKNYPSRSFHSRKGTWGVGIASKYPIHTAQHFPVKPHRIPGLQAIVTIDDSRLMVACLHLFPPVGKHRKSDGFFETLKKNEQLRLNQARYLIAKYAKWKGPLILMGDMNEGADGDAVQLFVKEKIVRSCDKAPIEDCGATYPGATGILPAVFEIDHILGRNVEFKTAGVFKKGGSDHYPVYSEIALINRGRS